MPTRKRWASTLPRPRQSHPGTARPAPSSAAGRGPGEPVDWARVLMKGLGPSRLQGRAQISILALDRRPGDRRRTRAGRQPHLLRAALGRTDSAIHPTGSRIRIVSRNRTSGGLRRIAFRPARWIGTVWDWIRTSAPLPGWTAATVRTEA